MSGYKYIQLDAFNAKRGAVLLFEPDQPALVPVRYVGVPFVVQVASRDVDNEVIQLKGRWARNPEDAARYATNQDTIYLAWGEAHWVNLIGLSVNPDDADDNDFGIHTCDPVLSQV